MVLLPANADEDVTRPGTSPSAGSTELASEAAPVKVDTTTTTSNSNPVARPSSAPKDDRATGTQETPPPSPPSVMAGSSEDVVRPPTTQSSARRSVPFLARPLSPYRPSHAPLSLVNPCITCNLCKGYLIDATTIVECLHSFCHSCIMKHLRTEQYCPQCEMMINKAKPNIKPDATLQAIVYKLVPGLYENELRRRRAFYRLHPEMAAIATPEQRGDDTEHLIFGPNEKISLSLEYAEKELAQDNEELLTPKYLLCPALFSVAHLKKFIIFKYGISERQFCVEIMYKVKTIILPDYYTLMDVAYIYTWKRDAPMKYFYRIRTTEVYPIELADIPFHRRPSVASQGGGDSSSETVVSHDTKEDDEDDKENISHHQQQRGAVTGPPTTDTATPVTSHGGGVKATQRRRSELPNGGGSADQPAVKPPLSANQQRPGTPDPNRKLGGAAEPSNGTTGATPVVARKNEAIKLKIELNKNKYISILQSPQADIPVGRPDKPEKVKRKKSDSSGSGGSSSPSASSSSAAAAGNGNGSELKMKIGKIKYPAGPAKEGKGGRKSSPPYKVEQLSLGCFETMADEGKKGSKSFSLSSGSKKLKPAKYHHPIVLKIDQRTPDMATSTLKFGMSPKDAKSKTPSPPPPLPPMPPSPPEVVNKFQDAKSQFLNEFNLAPINSTPRSDDEKPRESIGGSRAVSGTRTDAAPKAAGSISPPSKSVPAVKVAATNGATAASPMASLKRKPKDCAQRPGPKKPKLSDEEVKALVEKTVAENINSPRGCMLSMSYFKPTAAPGGRPPSISPPITAGDDRSGPKKPKMLTTGAKPGSPRSTFLFRAPMMPPPPAPPSPPIVCASNIPAVKPTQQIVIPAPAPLKPDPVEYPARKEKAPADDALPSLMKQPLVIPQRRPTMPTKLPTSNTASTNTGTPKLLPPSGGSKQSKPLELKRAQNNPSININPPAGARDTEISKLRPEDIKKNVKVYGPPADPTKPPQARTDGFAVPTKTAPKSASSSTSASSTPATVGGHNKVRPVNYLNYAQFNSKTAPAGSRTPIPSYSPSYSPDSPQYNPNFSISTKQFRYANPLAYSNYLQNMLSDRDRKSGGEPSVSPPLSLSPATSPASSPSPPHLGDTGVTKPAPKPAPADRKRPASAMSPESGSSTTSPTSSGTTGATEPAEKKPIVQSLLTKINIPSSLSITLATEEDEVARQTARKMRESDPAHNHIQIVKLPEIPITEVALSTSGPSTTASVSVSSGLAVTITPAAATTSSSSLLSDRRTPPQQPMKLSPGAGSSTAGKKDDGKVVSPPGTSRKSPEAGQSEGYQQKFLDSIEKKPSSGKAAAASATAAAAASGLLVKYGVKDTDTPSTVVTVAPAPAGKPSAPCTTPSSASGGRFKHPNATVFSNGIVMLSSYPESDGLAPKGGKGARPSTTTASATNTTITSTSTSTSTSSSAKGLMPPPKVAGLGAPKPSATSDASSGPPAPHPKAISPPIMPKKSITPPGLSLHKSKAPPPPNVPSMASMGPMFGIQMKSDANAAILAASSASSSTTTSPMPTTAVRRQSVGGSASVPRRKIVPTNNSTSLVPLKTSPPSSGSKTAPVTAASANTADYITLTPQTSKAAHPMLMPPPPPVSASPAYGVPSNATMLYELLKAQHHQNQQQAAFASLMDSTLMMKHYNLLMQQLSQSSHNGLGQDSLTITTSPAVSGGSPGGKLSPAAAAAAQHHQAMLQAHHHHQQHLQQQMQQQQAQAQQALNSLTVTAIRSPNGTTAAAATAGSGSRPNPPKALGGVPMPSRGPGTPGGSSSSNGTVS